MVTNGSAPRCEGIASTAFAENDDTCFDRTFALGTRASPVGRARSPSRVMDAAADALSRLMERYANGEAEVFEQIYRLLAPRLYRFCRRLAIHEPEADDCFQETFLKLHRARATYVSGSNVVHWAFAIARSVYLTRLRYWRRRPEELGAAADVADRDDLQPVHATTPEAEVAAEHLVDIATMELSKMSEKNRIAYTLVKEEGVSVKDAAALLGTTPDAVKQRAHRAYEQIRTALEASG